MYCGSGKPWERVLGGNMEEETRLGEMVVEPAAQANESLEKQATGRMLGVEEGEVYNVAIRAKDARGAGIGRVGNFVIFIKNAKTRIGNIYKVKVTKVYRTFAYAELAEGGKQFIGNGSLLEL